MTATKGPEPTDDATLNAKQARFVEEYLVDLNGKQAAIRAGYSPNSAEVQASRLLSDAKVGAAVRAALEARSERTAITADKVLQEAARIAFSDVRNVLRWGVRTGEGDEATPGVFLEPLNSDDLSADVAAAVSEVSLGRSGFRIKMHDKRGALETLGRHLGLNRDPPVRFEVGEIAGPKDALLAAGRVLKAMGDGHLNAAEAGQVMGAISNFARAWEVNDQEARLAALEAGKGK